MLRQKLPTFKGNYQGKSVNFNLLVKEVEKTNNPTSETFVLPNLGAFRLLCNPPFHTPPSFCLFPLWFMLSSNFDKKKCEKYELTKTRMKLTISGGGKSIDGVLL